VYRSIVTNVNVTTKENETMRTINGYTSSLHYGGHGIVDHRRSFTTPLVADGFEQRLDGTITIQDSPDDDHVLTHVEWVELSGQTGSRLLRGLSGNVAWFPARHGRRGSIAAWLMSFGRSHLYQFETNDTFTACELLGLAFAIVEAEYPTSAMQVA
jgi:hypothetical protein